ncbi:hypothetical protein [Streptomyces nanshensis]|uniref:hypothetical protein n=1 Tax=Streptomyces nanshensis TaxID=518642 RepID=UPI0009A033B7|nr:hypothetical protein [Streptomyces nanshensis]
MRLRVEFTTEPFDLDEAPEHALVAREVLRRAPLDSVDVGPFGNTAEGPAEQILGAVRDVLHDALGAGATRVSLQLNVLPEGEQDGPDGGPAGGTAGDASGGAV